MTQKEKLMRASIMAQKIKHIAQSLRHYADAYDIHFPFQYTDELEDMANEFLKLK